MLIKEPVYYCRFFFYIRYHEGGDEMSEAVKDYLDLPLTMSVEKMGQVLGVSRKVAYKIANESGLAVRVGEKRLVVPRHKLVEYLNR